MCRDSIFPRCTSKFYRHGDKMPETVIASDARGEGVMSCQAARHAAAGHPLLTAENIGCVAAAISLGLIDENRETPLEGRRVYTCLMEEQTTPGPEFRPPAPRDFSRGNVYACKDSGHPEWGLFGAGASGRFKDVETARKAVAGMTAIQPAVMSGVFFFSNNLDDPELTPDVVLLSVRPVELALLIHGYQYLTGKRINASMGPVRAVDSDLIARPYLTGEINVSTYCLGARLVARYEADRLGMGIPWERFKELVQGVVESRTGYPFRLYPGAAG